jgi:TetR/AcrR family transcriptional repressor of nem operon
MSLRVLNNRFWNVCFIFDFDDPVTARRSPRERSSTPGKATAVLERSFLYCLQREAPSTMSRLPDAMPRAKEFDPDEVLEQAMELFWENGFEATSAQDLVDRTGLNRSSLYNTFGSKQELYLRALDHYRRQGDGAFDHLLDQFDSARAAIRHLLDEGAPDADDDTRGCFLASATVERAHCDADTRERVRASFSQMRDGFEALVEHGQSRGEFPADCDPTAIAHFLASTYYGMQTMARLGLERDVFDDVVDGALRALD